MKEIRHIYIQQKKKEIRNHFVLVGIAAALVGALSAITANLDRLREML